jgi:hypothetical protein
MGNDLLLTQQPMITMFAVLYGLILLEVLWDGYHELFLGKSPDYEGSNIVRMMLGSIYWICFPLVSGGLEVVQWFWIPVMAMLNFWFWFDFGLNVFRKIRGLDRTIYYLGENNRIDRWQIKYGGARQWFIIKALLAMLSVIFFFVLGE